MLPVTSGLIAVLLVKVGLSQFVSLHQLFSSAIRRCDLRYLPLGKITPTAFPVVSYATEAVTRFWLTSHQPRYRGRLTTDQA